MFRRQANGVEVFLVHPGGPFWGKKDVWSIPKGELDGEEDHLQAAKREFGEETGLKLPVGKLISLGEGKQPGKINYIWAVEGDLDVNAFHCSSTFAMDWPPNSGQQQEFPENDRAAWMNMATAKQKLFQAQTIFIDRLAEHLGTTLDEPPEQASLF